MAYMFKDDEELQKRMAKNAPGGAVGGVISGGGGAASAPIAPKPSSFVGISQYLDANKNQAADLANKVGGYVEKGADDVKQATNSATNNAITEIQKHGVGLDSTTLGQLGKDPTKVNADYLSKMLHAGDALNGVAQDYSAADKTKIDSSKKTLAERVNDLGTEEGRKALINQTYSAPQRSQTAGAGNFDNLLLQSAPGSKTRLKTAADNAKAEDLQKYIDAGASSVKSKYNSAQGINKGVADKARGALDTARTGFEASTSKSLDDRIKAIQDANIGAVNRLKNGEELSDADLGLLGIDRTQANELRGASDRADRTKDAVLGDMSNLTRSRVATPEEQAKYRALMRLSGLDSHAPNAIFDYDSADAGNYGKDYVDYRYRAAPPPPPPPPPPKPVSKPDPTKGEGSLNPHAAETGDGKPRTDRDPDADKTTPETNSGAGQAPPEKPVEQQVGEQVQETGQQILDTAGNIVSVPIEAVTGGLSRVGDSLTKTLGSTKGGTEGGAPGAYKGKGGKFITDMTDEEREKAPKTIKAPPPPPPPPPPVVIKRPPITVAKPSKNATKTVGGKAISELTDIPEPKPVAPPPPPPPAPVIVAPPPPPPPPPVNTAAVPDKAPTKQEKKFSKLMEQLEKDF